MLLSISSSRSTFQRVQLHPGQTPDIAPRQLCSFLPQQLSRVCQVKPEPSSAFYRGVAVFKLLQDFIGGIFVPIASLQGIARMAVYCSPIITSLTVLIWVCWGCLLYT